MSLFNIGLLLRWLNRQWYFKEVGERDRGARDVEPTDGDRGIQGKSVLLLSDTEKTEEVYVAKGSKLWQRYSIERFDELVDRVEQLQRETQSLKDLLISKKLS